MDNENETPGGLRERGIGGSSPEIWGAKDSLRKHKGLDNITSSEVSPLLGSGSGSSQDGEERRESQWAGFADYEGLTWRHKPSVRTPFISVGSKLMSVDILADRPILPPDACYGRYHGPKAQLDTTARVPAVFYRV